MSERRIKSLEEMLQDMKDGIYDFTKDGECSGCGSCCSDALPVSRKEYKRILKYIQSRHIRECVHRPPTVNPVYDMTCPFRDDVKRVCTIYPVRPAVCRDFRCDKARNGIWADPKMYDGEMAVISMRKAFYPEEAKKQ